MLTYWQYLMENPTSMLFFVICGALVGLSASLENAPNIKERLGYIMIGILCLMVTLFPLSSWGKYAAYRNNYVTCDKPAARSAGYIFSDNKCWKPYNAYVTVDTPTKTKQELLNAK